MTTADHGDVLKLAKQFSDASKAADVGTADKLLDPDFKFWANYTKQTLGKAEMLGYIGTFFPTLRSVEYRNVRVTPSANGYVLQQVTDTVLGDGSKISDLDVCMVIQVRDGRLLRIDEYLDAAAIAPKK
jgi:ketosteroid isomerase-like protein